MIYKCKNDENQNGDDNKFHNNNESKYQMHMQTLYPRLPSIFKSRKANHEDKSYCWQDNPPAKFEDNATILIPELDRAKRARII